MTMLNVMIIEDDIIPAKGLKNTLESFGFGVTGIAKNSEKAYSLFNNTNPDLALVDIDLKNSEFDGIEIVNQFNQIHKIPIIYLTSYSQKILIERAKYTEPLAYLTKPCTSAQLLATIELALYNFAQKKQTRVIGSSDLHFNQIEGCFFTKNGRSNVRININEILWIEADGGNIIIITETKKVVVCANLSSFCRQVVHPSLLRVHRSYVVNLSKVISYQGRMLFLPYKKAKKSIIMSESKMEVFKKRILRLKAD